MFEIIENDPLTKKILSAMSKIPETEHIPIIYNKLKKDQEIREDIIKNGDL